MTASARLAILCWIVLSLALLPARAQTLHLVAIADSNDAEIGDGAAANSARIIGYMRRVASVLKLGFSLQSVEGEDFSCASITGAVDKVKAEQNDIVVFLYSGHGFRTVSSATAFPSFYCSTDDPQMRLPNLSDESGRLAGKGARLVIAVADTCNIVLPPPPIPKPAPAAKPAPVLDETQLRSLFMRHRGLLVMSSSTPGQYSWYYPTGGLFTTQLLRALSIATGPGRAGLWTDVIPLAVREFDVEPAEGPPVKQTPQASDASLFRM